MYSQNFEIVPYNSSETSGAPPCRAWMIMVSIRCNKSGKETDLFGSFFVAEDYLYVHTLFQAVKQNHYTCPDNMRMHACHDAIVGKQYCSICSTHKHMHYCAFTTQTHHGSF